MHSDYDFNVSDYIDLADYEDCCERLRSAARKVTNLYEAYLKPYNIRATQFSLLLSLARLDCDSITETAQYLEVDRTTFSRNCALLIAQGYLKWGLSKDSRSKRFLITEKGREVIVEASKAWNKAQHDLILTFSPDRYTDFHRELNQLIRTVDNLFDNAK